MGNWFRDYVYRPLGGDRDSLAGIVRNTLVTWTLFGLWHGASWTFVLWGLYQGTLLAGYRVLKQKGWLPRPGPGPTALGYAVIPLSVCLSSVYFRAASVPQANAILGRIVTMAGGQHVSVLWLVFLACLYVIHWAFYLRYREGELARAAWPRRLAWVGAALAVIALGAGSGEPFYYFQF
jgi:alginate O-acetyltransferase complex protein AlgI